MIGSKFIVFCQSSLSAIPCIRSFDNPSLVQLFEARLSFFFWTYFDKIPIFTCNTLRVCSQYLNYFHLYRWIIQYFVIKSDGFLDVFNEVIMKYPSDLRDAQWELIRELLPMNKGKKGFQTEHSNRDMIDAILYLNKTGCQWRYLPNDFPHWKAVYSYFYG